MYNDIKRDKTYIDRLSRLISDEYGICAQSIAPTARGYYGETWKLDTGKQTYFIKLDYIPRHRRLLRGSLPVVNYLCSQGIDFISHVEPTRNGNLNAEFDGAVLAIFDWIDGKNVETDATKSPEYQLLSRIYPLSRPGFDIPCVEYSDASARLCYALWDELKRDHSSQVQKAVLELLERNAKLLERSAIRLNYIAVRARDAGQKLFLTHGDAGGNFYVGNDRNYILDWDEVMYAPLERDAWVMCCRDWARKLFDDTMHAAGIDYSLRLEVLMFYCYHMFFFYLSEFLTDAKHFDLVARLEQYFGDSWITERVEFADKVYQRWYGGAER